MIVPDAWGEFEESEFPGIPMTLGPAPGGPAGPASGVGLDTGLMAAELNWTVSPTDIRRKTIRVDDSEIDVDAITPRVVNRQ